MWVDEKKDTSYHWATAGGAEKIYSKIPRQKYQFAFNRNIKYEKI